MRTDNHSSGFTLVEMSAVIATLFLVVALVVPNLVAMQRSRRMDDVKAAVIRLPAEARNRARRSGETVRLRVEQDALVLEQVTGSDDPTEVKRVSFSEALTVDSVQDGDEQVTTDDWEWDVFPDGSSTRGAVLFREGSSVRSLVLGPDGQSTWIAGEPAQTGDDEWEAGELEIRG